MDSEEEMNNGEKSMKHRMWYLYDEVWIQNVGLGEWIMEGEHDSEEA